VRGHSVECFIEGGRSRTGKVLPPKNGFMRGVMDAVIDRKLDNVYVVPIALGYDRLVENNSYIRELTGGKKRAEQLMSFVKSTWSLLQRTYNRQLNFGKITVGIGEPIALQAYISQQLAQLPESSGGPIVVPSPQSLATSKFFFTNDDAEGTASSSSTVVANNGGCEKASGAAEDSSSQSSPPIDSRLASLNEDDVDTPLSPTTTEASSVSASSAATSNGNDVVNILEQKKSSIVKTRNILGKSFAHFQ